MIIDGQTTPIELPVIAKTGSFVTCMRVWRTAKWPNGLYYYEEPREIQYPLPQREDAAMKAERWVPAYLIWRTT